LAARLLSDAAAFLDTIGRDNPALLPGTLQNAIGYRQVAEMLRKDSGGASDKATHAERAAKLLRGAAGFFTMLSAKLPPMRDQTFENAKVFPEVAQLLERDPLGSLTGPYDGPAGTSNPMLRALVAKLQPRSIKAEQHAVAGKPRRKAARGQPAEGAAAGRPKPPLERRLDPGDPVANRHPLSAENDRLNGHCNCLDPGFGLSFATAAVPDPVTVLWSSGHEAALISAVARRANHVCRYCGLSSHKYQQAVGPFDAVTNSQARCACMMCAQVMALDRATDMRSGVLIHLPEIGQAQLNALMRIIYVCRISQGSNADLARASLAQLMARREMARARFGGDDPATPTAALADAPDRAAYDAVLGRARDLRLMPLDRRVIREADLEFNQFPQSLAYWRSKAGPFGDFRGPAMELRAFRQILDDALGKLAEPAD